MPGARFFRHYDLLPLRARSKALFAHVDVVVMIDNFDPFGFMVADSFAAAGASPAIASAAPSGAEVDADYQNSCDYHC
eukprot:2940296-Pyramimonas_sp.AAC.1